MWDKEDCSGGKEGLGASVDSLQVECAPMIRW